MPRALVTAGRVKQASILLAWLTPLVLWWLALSVDALSQPPAQLALGQLDWVERGQALQPPFELNARESGPQVTLRTEVSRSGAELYALYLPSVESNIEATLDGIVIGQGGPLDQPRRRVKHRPLWFPLTLAAAGPSELQLRLVSDGPVLSTQNVYFGPADQLQSAYTWRYRYKVNGMQLVTICIVTAVLLIGSLWVTNRADAVLGWFALGIGFWGVHNLNFILIDQPFGAAGWQLLIHIALAGFVYCMTLFAWRYAGEQSAPRERLLLLAYLVVIVLMALLIYGAGWSAPVAINLALRPLLFLNSVYMTLFYLRLAFTGRVARNHWLSSANLTAFSFGVHDSLVEFGVLPVATLSLFQYSSVLVLFAFGGVLLLRFEQSRRMARELYQQQEAEVRKVRAELQKAATRRLKLERTATLARERERIMRDMHDGIGGQLISLLSAVRSGGAEATIIEGAVEGSLRDLRMIIDSLDEASEDLAVALGMFRSRIEPTLRASGIQLHWATSALPDEVNLGPERLLHVYRVLQEALQNAIKHAEASNIWISVEVATVNGDRFVDLTVRDDGGGLPAELVAGHGLDNMHDRAQRAGGELRVRDADPGTEVRLRTPWRLPRAPGLESV